jgi:PHP family Zn ribbon phosphoesterase
MNLTELRKLVSKLNKQDRIVGVWKMKKPDILSELQKIKYSVDEVKKQLVPSVEMKRKRIIKL